MRFQETAKYSPIEPSRSLHYHRRHNDSRAEVDMYRKVLLAYAGSQSGRTALLECADINNFLHAEIHLLAVAPLMAGLYQIGRASCRERVSLSV